MKEYQSIVILTGAGISAESGIQTFRAADGLWENHRVEDVATPEAFVRDPELAHRFYNARRQYLLNGIKPNAAHAAIANFSKAHPDRLTLVTQNIDNLHQQAGNDLIYPMHGELLKIRCKITGQLFDCNHQVSPQDQCPCCQTKGNLRPHVVWFGEMPLYMNDIEQALRQCDLFISIGTSGNVYPAAGFFQTAKYYGAHTVELNLEASASGSLFDEQHYGPATQIVPKFFNSLR
ncbi:MAG: Sir2 family NAD+-dependent deacetylase [Cellvibrionaceae bacterium]